MATTLSSADQQYLTADQQAKIRALKDDWEAANAAGDRAAMCKAHLAAESIRAGAGYTGGMDGNGYDKIV